MLAFKSSFAVKISYGRQKCESKFQLKSTSAANDDDDDESIIIK